MVCGSPNLPGQIRESHRELRLRTEHRATFPDRYLLNGRRELTYGRTDDAKRRSATTSASEHACGPGACGQRANGQSCSGKRYKTGANDSFHLESSGVRRHATVQDGWTDGAGESGSYLPLKTSAHTTPIFMANLRQRRWSRRDCHPKSCRGESCGQPLRSS